MELDGRHFSPYNLQGVSRIKPTVVLNDITLREGEETPGIVFEIEEKSRIARSLESLGVRQIQVGVTGFENEARELCRLGLSCKTEFLADVSGPNWKENLDKALGTGADIIDLLFSGSPYFISAYDPPPSLDQYVTVLLDCLDSIRSQGLMACVSPMDGARSRIQVLRKMYEIAVEGHADRVRVLDSVGTLAPAGMRYLIRTVRAIVSDKPIVVHCHNDLGQALANALTAAEEGVDIVDVTVTGLGARSGVPDLAQAACALTFLYETDTKLNLKGLCHVYEELAQITKRKIPDGMPIVGAFAFASVMDFDLQAESQKKGALQSIQPEEVGNAARILIHKYSGSYAVKEKMRQLGFDQHDIDALDESTVSEIVRTLTKRVKDKGNYLSDEESFDLIRGYTKRKT